MAWNCTYILEIHAIITSFKCSKYKQNIIYKKWLWKSKMEINFGHKFIYFSPRVYKWPSQRFLGLSERFWKIFKSMKSVTSTTRWLIWMFGYLLFSCIMSFMFLKCFTSGLSSVFLGFSKQSLKILKLVTLMPRWLIWAFGYLLFSHIFICFSQMVFKVT